MRLARLQGGSGRESRARAGRFGTIYALKGGIGMGGASFRAEPRGHHAAACTLRAATAWRHEGPPERILRAKPLRARSGKGSARKFPYVTEHGALGLLFAWDGKESGDYSRYVTETIESTCRIEHRTLLSTRLPRIAVQYRAFFPNPLPKPLRIPAANGKRRQRNARPGRARQRKAPTRRQIEAKGRPSRGERSGRAPLGSKRSPLLRIAPGGGPPVRHRPEDGPSRPATSPQGVRP